MAVIVSFYKDETDDLLRSNPGFVSRMPYEIRIDNNSKEQLSQPFFLADRLGMFVVEGNYLWNTMKLVRDEYAPQKKPAKESAESEQGMK